MKVEELIGVLSELPPSLDIGLSLTPINDIDCAYRFVTHDIYEIREVIPQHDRKYGMFCNIILTQRNKKELFPEVNKWK